MTNWEQLLKLILLTQEVGEELNINHFMVIQHLKQIGKVNKLNKWVSHEQTENQKLSFWSVLFYVTTTKLFLIGLWCVMKVDFIWQLATTSSGAGPRRSYKVLLTGKLAWKKGHDHCLVVAADLMHYSFLNPGETITPEKYAQQIEDLHRKLQCLQPALSNRKGPILHDYAQPHVAQARLQKLNKLGYEVLLIHYVHLTSQNPTTTFSSNSTTFCKENASTISRRQKMLSKGLSNPKAWVFMLQE